MSIRFRAADLLHRIAGWIGGPDYMRHALQAALDDVMEEFATTPAFAWPEVPAHWQSRYYMTQSFHPVVTDDAPALHWLGGPPAHRGAECRRCHKPLRLLWDIDCEDARIRRERPELFGSLKRLPFYYCMCSGDATAYRVVADEEVRTFVTDETGDETPFTNVADSFRRRPLRLDLVPREVANAMILAYEIDCDWLNATEWQAINSFFGPRHEGRFRSLNYVSQFGGLPRMLQAHRELICPNPECETRGPTPESGTRRGYYLKELAVVTEDAGLELEMHAAQIAFHICWNCLTIHGDYRCD